MIDEKISSVMLQPPSKGRAHNAHYHLALGRGQRRNQLAALDARNLAEVAASLPVLRRGPSQNRHATLPAFYSGRDVLTGVISTGRPSPQPYL
jgi:hypothetical protein